MLDDARQRRTAPGNLPRAFPLTDDDSDQAREKTLKYWTAQDFRNCDYMPRGEQIAVMLDEAGGPHRR
jgi:hypothetical protein